MIRLVLIFVGIMAVMMGGFALAGGGTLILGTVVAAVESLLLGVAVFIPEAKRKATKPQGKEPLPVSACEHEWYDEDTLLNYDPKCHRCLKCGETFWG